jgi:superfamily II DNA/RNA helicase
MMEDLRVQTLYGGSIFIEGNNFSNKKTPHVICGCPGRVFDMLRRNKISSKNIEFIKNLKYFSKKPPKNL